jgi:hypothetical protein
MNEGARDVAKVWAANAFIGGIVTLAAAQIWINLVLASVSVAGARAVGLTL